MTLDRIGDGWKVVGDAGATAGAALVTLSHWAEIITPILTLLIALATLAWWIVRFVDRVKGGGV